MWLGISPRKKIILWTFPKAVAGRTMYLRWGWYLAQRVVSARGRLVVEML